MGFADGLVKKGFLEEEILKLIPKVRGTSHAKSQWKDILGIGGAEGTESPRLK